MKITKFNIDNGQKSLFIDFYDNNGVKNTAQLTFEYLRINSPEGQDKNGKAPVIFHKKDVLLANLESVAKHGYRFIFNDGHKTIFSESDIQTLVVEKESRWTSYLKELKLSGHSRETMIDFKQL